LKARTDTRLSDVHVQCDLVFRLLALFLASGGDCERLKVQRTAQPVLLPVALLVILTAHVFDHVEHLLPC
jgi:hypothetical protein